MKTDFELSCSWNVYFSRNDVENWDDRLVHVTSFSTIRSFWALYQHLALPSQLPVGCDYLVFRDGTEPHWENSENIAGGRWSFQMRKTESAECIDDKWLETLLALIGEQLPEQVNGAIVQSRVKQDRISIWTKDCAQLIGKCFRDLAKPWGPVIFQRHASRNSLKGNYLYCIHPTNPNVVQQCQ